MLGQGVTLAQAASAAAAAACAAGRGWRRAAERPLHWCFCCPSGRRSEAVVAPKRQPASCEGSTSGRRGPSASCKCGLRSGGLRARLQAFNLAVTVLGSVAEAQIRSFEVCGRRLGVGKQRKKAGGMGPPSLETLAHRPPCRRRLITASQGAPVPLRKPLRKKRALPVLA